MSLASQKLHAKNANVKMGPKKKEHVLLYNEVIGKRRPLTPRPSSKSQRVHKPKCRAKTRAEKAVPIAPITKSIAKSIKAIEETAKKPIEEPIKVPIVAATPIPIARHAQN